MFTYAITVAEIVEQHKRLDIPMSLEVLKKAQIVALKDLQPQLFTDKFLGLNWWNFSH